MHAIAQESGSFGSDPVGRYATPIQARKRIPAPQQYHPNAGKDRLWSMATSRRMARTPAAAAATNPTISDNQCHLWKGSTRWIQTEKLKKSSSGNRWDGHQEGERCRFNR
jgi:hypothetical protein